MKIIVKRDTTIYKLIKGIMKCKYTNRTKFKIGYPDKMGYFEGNIDDYFKLYRFTKPVLDTKIELIGEH